MAAPVTILEVTPTDTTLPKVPAHLMPDFPEYESAATEHWIFDRGDSAGLTGIKGGLVLTPVGAVAPTYPGSFVRLPGGGLRALETPFDDNQQGTECFVIRYPLPWASSTFTVIFGSEIGTGGGGGEFLLISNLQRLMINVRGGSSFDLGAGSMVGDQWLFVAQSRTATSRSGYRGNGGTDLLSATSSQTKTLATPMRKMAIGNAYRSGTGYVENALDVAEAIFFPGALSAGQIATVYANSRERMADRGLSIL